MQNTVLIVEDEKTIADAIAFALKTEGFTPRHVMLGSAALSLLQDELSQQCCLVILDIGLPDANGFDICRRLRQFSDVPVIFLTARSEEVDRIVGLELGADDYVTKPFSPRELVTRVKTILRRARPGPNEIAKRSTAESPFELREAEACILYCGKALDLTRYEYLLLKTLLAQQGRVFSRAQLMDMVWTDASDTLERTVDGHIKTLRAKLRTVNPANDVILTHRGMGYSLRTA